MTDDWKGEHFIRKGKVMPQQAAPGYATKVAFARRKALGIKTPMKQVQDASVKRAMARKGET